MQSGKLNYKCFNCISVETITINWYLSYKNTDWQKINCCGNLLIVLVVFQIKTVKISYLQPKSLSAFSEEIGKNEGIYVGFIIGCIQIFWL